MEGRGRAGPSAAPQPREAKRRRRRRCRTGSTEAAALAERQAWPQITDRAWSWPKKGCLPSPPAYMAPSARSTVQRMRRRTGGAATPALRTSPAPSHSAEYNCQRPCRQSGHWKMTSSCSTKCLKVKLLTGPTLDTNILCLGIRWLQHPQPCLTRVR